MDTRVFNTSSPLYDKTYAELLLSQKNSLGSLHQASSPQSVKKSENLDFNSIRRGHQQSRDFLFQSTLTQDELLEEKSMSMERNKFNVDLKACIP